MKKHIKKTAVILLAVIMIVSMSIQAFGTDGTETGEEEKYLIEFVDNRGIVLYSEKYEYGETPVYAGETPQKDFDRDYHYIFTGWDPEIEPVAQEMVYMAKFRSQTHDPVYVSDGAMHHGECECGYVTDSQVHSPDSDGKCAVCGIDVSAFYIDFGDVMVTSTGASGYNSRGDYVSVGILNSYTVTQHDASKAANHSVNIVSGSPVVVLDNINIERTGMTAYAVSVQNESSAKIVLKGENHITSGVYRAGLDIAIGSLATIEGEGILYAVSPLQAGIGGGNGRSNGSLIINSGEIYATGGVNGYSAGIGGGTSGEGGNIIINGGYVVATGGIYGSGIGGGNGFGGGNIVINGGTVTATGGKYAAGIGGGYTGNSGSIVINGGSVKATAGANAQDIGGGYKCPDTFFGVHNSQGELTPLVVFDAGDAERVYFGGIDTEALRRHPEDNNYYFYTGAKSCVTAYGERTVSFYIGETLDPIQPYSAPAYREGEYLLVSDPYFVELPMGFVFYEDSLYYDAKRIDKCIKRFYGDANLDGYIDGEDSVIVNCIIAGMLTSGNLPEIRYAAADFDRDGEITGEDASLLELAGAKLSEHNNFPLEE